MSPAAGTGAEAEALRRIADTDPVLDQAKSENFPVASLLVPRRYRRHLTAVYGFCRLVDDLGDELEGDRDAALDWAGSELEAAFETRATHPLFLRLSSTIRQCGLERRPFLDLIAANRLDQVKPRCSTYAELLEYCQLSANPVGRLVLGVFGVSEPAALESSDRICTALQIVEHLQDVGEDFAAGRVYLPEEDLVRFDVAVSDLGGSTASSALRRLVAYEAARAGELFEDGRVLFRYLEGSAKVALAGFIGGGLAQLDALRGANYDVLGTRVKASKFAVGARSLRQFVAAGRS